MQLAHDDCDLAEAGHSRRGSCAGRSGAVGDWEIAAMMQKWLGLSPFAKDENRWRDEAEGVNGPMVPFGCLQE